jgi:predicted ester cyclase
MAKHKKAGVPEAGGEGGPGGGKGGAGYSGGGGKGRRPDNLTRNMFIMRRLLNSFWTGDTFAIDVFISPNIINHSPHPISRKGRDPRDALKEELRLPFQAFPDQYFREELLIAEGEMVFLGWEMTGTNTGPLYGKPPTGKPVDLFGGELARIKDEKVVEHFDHYSKPRLESLAELGLLTVDLLEKLEKAGLL